MADDYKLERIRKEEVMAKLKYPHEMYLEWQTNLDQTSQENICPFRH